MNQLRVVQWTTGLIGSSALRGIIEDPRLELVGVYARSASKVGVDAGALVGGAPTGVLATDDIDALLALKPDCVVYMPQWPDIAEMERILRAGVNVVTTARLVTGQFYPDDAGARLERAATEGGASLMGTGMNPGHISSIALNITGICRRVHHLTVVESLDNGMYEVPATWEAYGFGTPIEPERLNAHLLAAEPDFPEMLALMAAGLGETMDDMRLEVDYAAAVEDRDLGYMQIPKGTMSSLDAHWIGLVRGKPFVELRTVWKLGAIYGFHDEPDFPITYSYDVIVKGEPNVHTRLRFRPEDGDFDNFDYGTTTASPAVNAIAAVCAAAPGVLGLADAGLVPARGVPR